MDLWVCLKCFLRFFLCRSRQEFPLRGGLQSFGDEGALLLAFGVRFE